MATTITTVYSSPQHAHRGQERRSLPAGPSFVEDGKVIILTKRVWGLRIENPLQITSQDVNTKLIHQCRLSSIVLVGPIGSLSLGSHSNCHCVHPASKINPQKCQKWPWHWLWVMMTHDICIDMHVGHLRDILILIERLRTKSFSTCFYLIKEQNIENELHTHLQNVLGSLTVPFNPPTNSGPCCGYALRKTSVQRRCFIWPFSGIDHVH